MKKKILIFDDIIDGHHLEYLHHLYEIAQERAELDFVFSVPMDFSKEKDKYVWCECKHIEWDFIENEKVSNKEENLLLHSFRLCRVLREKSKNNQVNKIFLVSLMSYLPLLPLFFLFNRIKVSGIIYLVYLFRWKQSILITKALDVLKFFILSKCPIFDSVFILNSKASARYLNGKYSTDHFKYLPDPYENNFFNSVVMPSRPKKTILHFGSLAGRKGTLELLNSIRLLTSKESNQFRFVFAGRVNSDIKSEFYQLFESLKEMYDISLFDRFCSFEEINQLCAESDYIAIPYKSTAQSSGVIGYAAQYRKPLIAPSSGLVGKIVNTYKLGVVIDEVTPAAIYHALIKQLPAFDAKRMKAQLYLDENSLNAFKSAIESTF